ncbi:MAG: NHL repeat-containing protein, partial [Planctomycetota bacterium]
MTSVGKVHADSVVVGRIDPPGLNSASGITFDGDIHPVVVDSAGEVIWRLNIFDASVIATHYLTGGTATTRSLDYDFDSGAYYVSRREAGVNDTLFTVDPGNGAVDEVGFTGADFNFLDQAIDSVGCAGYLWLITDNGGGQLWLINKATGAGGMMRGYDGAMGDLTSIGFGPDGRMFVASLDGRFYEIYPGGSGMTSVNTTGLSGEDYLVDFEYDPFSGR